MEESSEEVFTEGIEPSKFDFKSNVLPLYEVTLSVTIHLLSVRVTIPAPPLYQSGALPNELTDNM